MTPDLYEYNQVHLQEFASVLYNRENTQEVINIIFVLFSFDILKVLYYCIS